MSFSDDPRRFDLPKKGRWKKRPKKIKVEPFVLPPLARGKRWYGPRFVYDWHTRVSTGEPLGLDVAGFKFDDSEAARWELVPADMQVTTPAVLLRQFRKEWRWWIKKPVAWVRNPEDREGHSIYGTDVIVVVYPRNFYIVIERYHREIFGPHPARLFYRSWQVLEETAWIAICQLQIMWHSDERMFKALTHEIRNRNFWHSEATAKEIVLR